MTVRSSTTIATSPATVATQNSRHTVATQQPPNVVSGPVHQHCTAATQQTVRRSLPPPTSHLRGPAVPGTPGRAFRDDDTAAEEYSPPAARRRRLDATPAEPWAVRLSSRLRPREYVGARRYGGGPTGEEGSAVAEYDDFDLDRTTRRAWGRFQSSLADHVVAMEDDDVLVVDAETWLGDDASGAAPYVQFCAWGDDLVRAEVSSNEYLDPAVALDRAGVEALVALG